MSELECSFVAASHRRARRRAWARRVLVAAVAGSAILAFAGRAAMQARVARELAEAKISESELEQGRAALLHGEPEAQRHLAEAYKRDPAPATAFMLARAMQPRLSELARLQGTHGRMRWATFSPDGNQVATADDRRADRGRARRSRERRHRRTVCPVALDGLQEVTRINAVDKFHALLQGIHFLELRIRDEVEAHGLRVVIPGYDKEPEADTASLLRMFKPFVLSWPAPDPDF